MACCGGKTRVGGKHGTVKQGGRRGESDRDGFEGRVIEIEEKEIRLTEGREWEKSISQSLFIKCYSATER